MKVNILILLFISISLLSCDPFYFKVAIDDNGFEKSYHFECGNIDVLCDAIGYKASIFLNFELDFPILINPKKFEISHKNIPIKTSVRFNDEFIEYKTIVNKGNQKIIIDIENYKPHVGDTLIINADNFILCNEKPLGIGDIKLVFVNRK